MDEQFEEAQKWINEFQTDSSNELLKNLGLLLGEDLSIIKQNWSIIELDRTLPIFTLPLAVSTIEISKSYSSKGIFVFQKSMAILLSGILSMFSKNILDEKLSKLDMDEADKDAFGEICNQLVGSLNRIMSDLLPEKIHIKQINTNLWERKKEMEFPFDDPYLISMPFVAKVNDFRNIKFHLILPVSIIDSFLERQIHWDLFYQKQTNSTNSSDEDEQQLSEEVQTLFIQLNIQCDSIIQTILTRNNIDFEFIESYAELKESILQYAIKLIILLVDDREQQGIALCNKINKDLEGYHIPIWLQGNKWNRDLALKAKKAGASYLTLAPPDTSRLETKIQEYFL